MTKTRLLVTINVSKKWVTRQELQRHRGFAIAFQSTWLDIMLMIKPFETVHVFRATYVTLKSASKRKNTSEESKETARAHYARH